jgi:hypothetical protein
MLGITINKTKEEYMKKYGAKFFGTFWLVLGGSGSAPIIGTMIGAGIYRFIGSEKS